MAEIEMPNAEELEEIKSKQFTRKVALTTAFFAVALAITSLGGNNAMKEMLLAQQQSSDQWAFYQSKVMREQLYRTQRIMLEMALLERGAAMKADAVQKYQATIGSLAAEEARYGKEKSAIQEEAKKLERERDRNRRKDPYFDYAEVLLQIAIVMSSIAILSSSRQIFWFSLVAAVIGSLLSINGYFLLRSMPFLE